MAVFELKISALSRLSFYYQALRKVKQAVIWAFLFHEIFLPK
jgi:hypothetical protein